MTDMGESTKPLSCRVPDEEHRKVEEVASRKGMKVGTYLRTVVPFIFRHPEILELDEVLLQEFSALLRNRNMLAELEAQGKAQGAQGKAQEAQGKAQAQSKKSLRLEQLKAQGFDPSKYTGFSVDGRKRTIKVLDYSLVESKPDFFTINKQLGYGNV